MTRENPAEGDYRITVPLLWTGVTEGAGIIFPGRLMVGDHVVMAEVDDRERERLAEHLARHPYDFQNRMEIHGFRDSPSEVPELVAHYLRLLSLVVRMAPYPASVVTDRFDGNIWIRDKVHTPTWMGSSGSYNYIPHTRLTTWAKLIDVWPAKPRSEHASLYRALDLYRDSVAEQRDKSTTKALLMSAIAFELLLGPGIHEELRHRMSTRGALLVANGEESRSIYRWLKKYYDVRSKLVHEGIEPDGDVVNKIHQFLMRALPSMFRLSQLTGSHAKAVEALDSAPFGRPTDLDTTLEDGWSSYVKSDWLAQRLV